MGHKSETEAMSELTSLMWSRYLKEQVRGELNHEMNAYKAEVVTNHGDGTLTVQRPFESVTLRLKAAPSLAYAQAGDMVLVVGIGDKTKALSNAFILCKSDLSDDTDVPVYGMGVNLIDNWYFVGGGSQQGNGYFPINNRGQTSYTGANAYSIDRWVLDPNGISTIQLASSGISLSGNASTGGYIKQWIEGGDLLKGKTVTYSVLYSSNGTVGLATGTGTVPTSYTTDGTVTNALNSQIPHGAGCGVYVRGSVGKLFVQIGQNAGYSITLLAAKLELGDTQTLAHLVNGSWVLNNPPMFEEELVKGRTSHADSADLYANRTVYVGYPSNRNYLRNWYFRGAGGGVGVLPVNTRAIQGGVYSGESMTIDGWFNRGSAVVRVGAGGEEGNLHISVSADSTYKAFTQCINEYRNELVGQTVTCSILVDYYTINGSSDWPRFGLWSANSARANTLTALNGVINGTGLFTVTGVIPNSILSYPYLNFSAYAVSSSATTMTGDIYIAAAKLELGDTQTLAHLENGTWVLNEIPSYEEELLKCQTSVDDPDDDFAHKVVNVTGAKVNPNLLDNWLFAGGGSQQGSGQFPINHRGQTSYSGNNTYCMDRWKIVTGTGGTPQANLFTGYVRLSATGNACYIQQRGIEWEALKGQSVTYSVLYDDGGVKLATGTGKIPTSLPSQTDNPNYATVVLLNSQIPHGSGCGLYVNYSGLCYAQIGQTVNNGLDIIAVKVEVGETQTLANWVVGTYGGGWVLSDIPNFQEEQLKCATSKLDSSDGGYSGFNAVVGKVSSGNPYMRFFMDNGYEYQFLLLANGNLAIQEYNGSTWTTLRQYAPTS